MRLVARMLVNYSVQLEQLRPIVTSCYCATFSSVLVLVHLTLPCSFRLVNFVFREII